MAAVAANRTGVFLHRSTIEAAEAQYLATGKTVKLAIGCKVSYPEGLHLESSVMNWT